jgi:aspartyl-tRNA(Asn)/glutamyl-tRNA(Gln) amidotransferase subunit B
LTPICHFGNLFEPYGPWRRKRCGNSPRSPPADNLSLIREISNGAAKFEQGKKDEIIQETRGWDDIKNQTYSQRSKESALDYRYFPEPDLPKLYLHELFNLEELKQNLPEIPATLRIRFKEQYNLADKDVEIYVQNKHLAEYFEQVAEKVSDLAVLALIIYVYI